MSSEYAAYQRPLDDDALAKLSRLATEQRRRELAVEHAESELKKRVAELADIAEVQIPELMDTLGVEEFTTSTGLKISVKTKIRASVLAAKRDAAFRWLRENGHAALIKRVIKVEFGMGEDAEAQRALRALGDLPVEDQNSVHSSTLAKFVGEVLESGRAVPDDLFSVHRQRVSMIRTKDK